MQNYLQLQAAATLLHTIVINNGAAIFLHLVVVCGAGCSAALRLAALGVVSRVRTRPPTPVVVTVASARGFALCHSVRGNRVERKARPFRFNS